MGWIRKELYTQRLAVRPVRASWSVPARVYMGM